MDEALLSRAHLLATGHTDAQIAAAVERGALVRVRRGVYARPERDAVRDVYAQERMDHRRLVLASASSLTDGTIFSHESAAIMHGLPLLVRTPRRVQVLSLRESGAVGSTYLERHSVGRLPESVVVEGVRVTSLVRTALDLARQHGFRTGLVAADAAIRIGGVTPEMFEDEVRALARHHGVVAARAVAGAARSGAESPGESFSRAVMLESGIREPVLQAEIRGDTGILYRVDFLWPGVKVVGEFDGRTKYSDGSQSSSALWQEKNREDALRRAGYTVVRWTWADIGNGTMVARLRDAGVL